MLLARTILKPRQTRREPITSNRSGFTLLELLLVVSIIGILAVMSGPRLLGRLKLQTLQGNSEQVRQLLDRARVRAVEEGAALQFRFEPGGKRFLIVPDDAADLALESPQQSSGLTTVIREETAVRREPYRIQTLGGGTFFHVDNALLSGQSVTSERPQENQIFLIENGPEAQDVSWVIGVVFYPDGSATDGSCVVMDESNRYIKIHVRGLTGAASAQPVAVMSEKFGATGN